MKRQVLLTSIRVLRRHQARPASRSWMSSSSLRSHESLVPSSANDSAVIDPLAPPPKEQSESRSKGPMHAVVSTFDLLSIGIGPSSSHTVGPMRAAKIFVESLRDADILQNVKTLKVALYGSLAATGKGHMSAEALLMGFESEDCETIDTDTVVPRYEAIARNKTLVLGATRQIDFDLSKDFTWYYDKVLPRHPNGMIFSVYDGEGALLVSSNFYSIGGGFIIDETAERSGENMFYKQIRKSEADPSRRAQSSEQASEESDTLSSLPALAPEASTSKADQEPSTSVPASKPSDPPFLFTDAKSMLELCTKNNLSIAQLIWNNERHWLTDPEIKTKLLNIYTVMDQAIHKGVTSNDEFLPGGLNVRRRAKKLYSRLTRGLYANPPGSSFTRPGGNDLRSIMPIIGQEDHPLQPIKPKRFSVPAMEILTVYAIACSEVNASGGRVVTAPTNGAAGTIPSVLKYFIEFVSTPDDAERDVMTFLLTASAIGMLFKRGSTISAAEGGCMAEVGVSSAMAAAGFAACLGASPSVIENAAEIAIEHNLGLTCDPIDGLVQVPCIERNALGAVKAVTAASLAIAGEDAGTGAVTLDQAISAMKETAEMMREELKETSRAGLARTSVRLPEC